MNFAIMKSAFGDYWIGKTKQEVNGKSIFSAFDAALDTAKQLNDSVENLDELENTEEEDIDEISEEMERWMI